MGWPSSNGTGFFMRLRHPECARAQERPRGDTAGRLPRGEASKHACRPTPCSRTAGPWDGRKDTSAVGGAVGSIRHGRPGELIRRSPSNC